MRLVTPPDVAERLEELRARISDAGGEPDRVTIVGVTKGRPPAAAAAAVAAGLGDLGENYADGLLTKQAALTAPAASRLRQPSGASEGGQPAPPCRWHFLGHVQRNKVRRLAPVVHLWQGVDRLVAGEEIARRSPGAQVLVQVNVSAEPQKNGCRIEDTPALVEGLRTLGLDVRGLMAVGPTGPPEMARPSFRTLTTVADRLGLPERSMGMSDDLEVAVQEGSTMVRVGRAIFDTGARRMSR